MKINKLIKVYSQSQTGDSSLKARNVTGEVWLKLGSCAQAATLVSGIMSVSDPGFAVVRRGDTRHDYVLKILYVKTKESKFGYVYTTSKVLINISCFPLGTNKSVKCINILRLVAF